MAIQKILWVDDEIELLKSHVRFLEGKGYEVSVATNGEDALRAVGREKFDILLLDESMPGMGGLETLNEIKDIDPSLHVVMITKNEAEQLMDDAMYKLWKAEMCTVEDILSQAHNPDELAKRIVNARRGMYDGEEGEDEAGEGDEAS